MRGFISFVLILGMLFPLALISSSCIKMNAEINAEIGRMASLEGKRSAEFEIKNAFGLILENKGRVGGIGADMLSSQLIVLENSLEAKYLKDGKKLDVWFGAANPLEMEAMGKTGSKMPCGSCHDFAYLTPEYGGEKLGLFSTAFVFVENGKWRISKKAASKFPEGLQPQYVLLPVYFGAILTTKTGNERILMPEGFG